MATLKTKMQSRRSGNNYNGNNCNGNSCSGNSYNGNSCHGNNCKGNNCNSQQTPGAATSSKQADLVVMMMMTVG